MFTVNDPLIHSSRGSPAQADAYARAHGAMRMNEVAALHAELYRLCELVGLDAGILVAQAAEETGNFTNKWWNERLNSGSIGITGVPAQDDASPTFKNGTDAARAQIIHMCAYVFGNISGSPERQELLPFIKLDTRWNAVFGAGLMQSVKVIGDLGNGKWATDPNYAAQIVAKANQIFGGPKPVTTPTIYNLATDYAHFGISQANANEVLSHRFTNRADANAQGSAQFIVLHIQAGNTKGSLEYWNHALGPSATVMAQHDGSLLRVIPEQHGPWTNGDDDQPTAAGKRITDLPGNSNLYTLSIETEGADGTDVTAKQLDAIEWQVRDWMTRYHIPIANVLRHADIDTVNKPNCPGAYYGTIMQRLVASPPGPASIQPSPIWWEPGDIGEVTRESDGAVALAMLGEVTAKRTVPLRKDADAKAPKVGEVQQGKTAKIVGTYKGSRSWVFVEIEPGKYGRGLLSAFSPYFPTT